MSLTVETLTGKAPQNYVIDHADPGNVKTRPLGRALRQELRGRFLNPHWLEGQMEHGYAGARTMGSEFLEYLWGWQVTNPTLVGDWAWEEVKAVYLEDRYELGLDEFLEAGHNSHVKSNMLSIMLVAIQKGFWQTDEETIRHLASEFVRLVELSGLPGSGHTDPDNPVLQWLEAYLSIEQARALALRVRESRGEVEDELREVHRIAEVDLNSIDSVPPAVEGVTTDDSGENLSTDSASAQAAPDLPLRLYLAAALFSALALGFYSGLRQSRKL